MNELELSMAFRPDEADLKVVKSLPADKLPKFSVVVPSFNQGRYLPDTLDSVIAQGYPNFEIFVSDGGSSDDSLAVIKRYVEKLPERVSFVSGPDGGQFDAVNRGIKETAGDLIAWINSDDVYLPDAFWKVAAFYHFNRCALVVYGRNRYTDENLTPKGDYVVDWSPSIAEQKRRMMHHCLPPQPSLFFRRAATQLFGLLQSPILDYELWLRWQDQTQFFFLDDYLSLSRVHDEAQSVARHKELLDGICETVHDFYSTVPMSWALRRAYSEEYGFVPVAKAAPPITRKIKGKAAAYWLYYNARLAPNAVSRATKKFVGGTRESLFGRL